MNSTFMRGTVRGRAGIATGPVLSYVAGGYAYGNIKTRVNSTLFGVTNNVEISETKGGWTVGGGIETRLWNSNWTAKAEYLYMDLGNQGSSNLVGLGPATHVSNVDFKDHIVRVGLNYKLGAY